MLIKRLTAIAALALLPLAAGALHAQVIANAATQPPLALAMTTPGVIAMPGAFVTRDIASAPLFTPLSGTMTLHGAPLSWWPTAAGLAAQEQAGDRSAATTEDHAAKIIDLRKALIGLAMDLRDVRYAHGGHDPATGFDCSGFVRYVFAHAIGMKLPTNSASQFLAGLKVDRTEMKPGDLVFFRTRGKHHISHVGIYLSYGRFIHSPTTGKAVQVSSLNEGYWARHFVGAKRPSAMVAAADKG